MLVPNRQRIAAQHGVATVNLVKTAVTGAAMAVTALARAEGAKSLGATACPSPRAAPPETPGDVTEAQRLRLLQWAVPASTAALLVVSLRRRAAAGQRG